MAYGFVMPIAVAALMLAASAKADVLLYDTFGPGMTFDRVNAWCVSGDITPDCGPLTNRWIASPFTPDATATLASIDVTLTNFSGTNGAFVELVNDNSGAPGTTVLESWTRDNLPSASDLATFAPESVTSVLHPVLDIGIQYWLIAEASAADTLDLWSVNILGLNGAFLSLDDGSTWILLPTLGNSGSTTAFDIRGMPEPASLALLGVSLAGLGFSRRRNQ